LSTSGCIISMSVSTRISINNLQFEAKIPVFSRVLKYHCLVQVL
jgi:hypothetical protein